MICTGSNVNLTTEVITQIFNSCVITHHPCIFLVIWITVPFSPACMEAVCQWRLKSFAIYIVQPYDSTSWKTEKAHKPKEISVAVTSLPNQTNKWASRNTEWMRAPGTKRGKPRKSRHCSQSPLCSLLRETQTKKTPNSYTMIYLSDGLTKT